MYSTWIKKSIERADLEQDKDFLPSREESTGGRPTIDYLLVRDAALERNSVLLQQKSTVVERSLNGR